MSRYEKNKNMYEFYVGDRTKPYGFNVNTGRFYGIKGSPIKSVPSELTFTVRRWSRESNVLCYISREIGLYGTARAIEHLSNAEGIKVLCLLDRLDAISSPIFDSYDIGDVAHYCDFLTENFKALSAYIKEKGEKARLCNFVSEYARELWFKTHNFQYTEHFTVETANDLYRYLRSNRHANYMNSKEIVSLYAYFLSRGIVDYHRGDVCSACAKIAEMLDMSKIAEIKVEKSDFFRQYVNIRRNYIINKTAYDAKAFVAKQNAHLKALTYENEELVVVIPTTPAELVAEGNAQHNCVGGYADAVIDGRCNIVFIRKKNNPTASYITCEIRNGTINQYLIHYNGYVCDQVGKDFKAEYAKHIAENW